MFDNALTQAARNLLIDLNHELTRLGFYLSSGTGLALHFGHRVSENLSFCSTKKFEPAELSSYLNTKTGYKSISTSLGTLHCSVQKVKLSFNHIPVPLLFPVTKLDNIAVANWQDILAEKFITLAQRGSRQDFYDIYACYIFGDIKIGEGVEILKRRFAGTDTNYYEILKSLAYFDIGDKEPELILLKPITWQTVKNFFFTDLKEFEKHLLKEEKPEEKKKK
jgi:hypothetical protein